MMVLQLGFVSAYQYIGNIQLIEERHESDSDQDSEDSKNEVLVFNVFHDSESSDLDSEELFCCFDNFISRLHYEEIPSPPPEI